MFKKITIEDMKWITPCLENVNVFACDYSPYTAFGWAELFSTEVCLINKCFTSRFKANDGTWTYLFPCGESDVNEAISKLENYHYENFEYPFRVLCNAKQVEFLSDSYHKKRIRDYDDYIYASDELINLRGAKYHSKRNLISQFDRKYNWTFKPLTSENIDDCKKIMTDWYEATKAESFDEEMRLLELAVIYPDLFKVLGGVLYVEDEPVAFSVASNPRKSMLDVHLEKANTAYTGVYAKITNEFTKYAYKKTGAEYVNREDDMGIENLRKAKLSLHPVFMEEKFICVKYK